MESCFLGSVVLRSLNSFDVDWRHRVGENHVDSNRTSIDFRSISFDVIGKTYIRNGQYAKSKVIRRSHGGKDFLNPISFYEPINIFISKGEQYGRIL